MGGGDTAPRGSWKISIKEVLNVNNDIFHCEVKLTVTCQSRIWLTWDAALLNHFLLV